MISTSNLEAMFELVGMNKSDLHAALRKMGSTYSKTSPRDLWTSDNPTKGYCAVVSGMVYSYVPIREGSVLVQMNLPHGGSHWFLGVPILSTDLRDKYIVITLPGKNPNAEFIVVDLTADQSSYDYKYSLGKRKGGIMNFWPQTGAQVLAYLLGFDYANPRRHSGGDNPPWRAMDDKVDDFR
jgi:hypothetical protein